jgi:surface antigen
MKKVILAVSALFLVFGAAVAAGKPAAKQTAEPQRDPYGYYSEQDRDGYYDREGNYIRYSDAKPDSEGYTTFNPPPDTVYRSGDYEENCRKGNAAAGTFFGALAGGLIGGAASSGGHGPFHHGPDAGAVIGGVILGGMLGNAVTRDIPCDDHKEAFGTYASGLNGRIGMAYQWNNPHTGDYGSFTPQREFRRGGQICRSFSETTYINGRRYDRSGYACRSNDGNWRFD